MSDAPKMEYRVVWSREGIRPKRKKYRTLKSALAWKDFLISPEPWVSRGLDPDSFICCSGSREECGCSGKTVREDFLSTREGLPPITAIRIDARTVGDWKEVRP
jgi:hypothetical protein